MDHPRQPSRRLGQRRVGSDERQRRADGDRARPGRAAEDGWKPKRTIILASWDGEEWGLLGSTEWAEKHADELSKNAVVYINSDSTGKGWLSASGSHSLQAFVNDLMRDLQDPKRGTSLFQADSIARCSQAKTDDEKRALRERKDFPLNALGSGSDYTAFLDFLTVASLDMDFGGDGGGGIYHSTYDSFYWYTHFSDTDFSFGAALSRTMGTALLRLADADVLPFEFTATAHALREYVGEIDKLRDPEHDGARARPGAASDGHRQTGQGGAATRRVDRASPHDREAGDYRRTAGGAESPPLHVGTSLQIRQGPAAPRVVQTSRYAPGFYTGYGVKTLPGIREGIEQKQWDEARTYIPLVAEAIGRLADQVEKAAALAQSP